MPCVCVDIYTYIPLDHGPLGESGRSASACPLPRPQRDQSFESPRQWPAWIASKKGQKDNDKIQLKVYAEGKGWDSQWLEKKGRWYWLHLHLVGCRDAHICPSKKVR